MAARTTQAAAGAAARVLERRQGRRFVVISNNGTGTDAVRWGAAQVSATLGHLINAGGGVVLDGWEDEVYLAASTGTPQVAITEVWG